MSWNAYLSCEACGECGSREWNYTHNTNGMIYEALDRIGYARPWDEKYGRLMSWWVELNSMTGAQSAPFLGWIVDAIATDPERYESMNPENGWGNRAGLLGVLREMRDAAQDNPRMVWECSG